MAASAATASVGLAATGSARVLETVGGQEIPGPAAAREALGAKAAPV